VATREGVVLQPETRFAKSGELSIAYQVVGDGPVDLVYVPGFMSHVELNWDYAFYSSAFERTAKFCRLVILDKRGTGLSDRSLGLGTLEDRMDDLRAVMDAVGLERAALMGVSEGGTLCELFSATYPERVTAPVLNAAACPGAPTEMALPTEVLVEWIVDHWTTGTVINQFIQHARIRQVAQGDPVGRRRQE
jgi:pimeloyl-ACP methyl ester carboxylesterase